MLLLHSEVRAPASLLLKEVTKARARARSGVAGGVESEEVEVEVEEEVEANDDAAAPPPAAAADANTSRVCILATAAGALLGAEATRDVVSCWQTIGRAAGVVCGGVGVERKGID